MKNIWKLCKTSLSRYEKHCSVAREVLGDTTRITTAGLLGSMYTNNMEAGDGRVRGEKL